MYKIIGLTIFMFVLIWNVWSGNNQLVKENIVLDNNVTHLSNELLLRDVEIAKYKMDLIASDLAKELLRVDIKILEHDLNASMNKKPVIKWRTEYKTNPQYVKCIDK